MVRDIDFYLQYCILEGNLKLTTMERSSQKGGEEFTRLLRTTIIRNRTLQVSKKVNPEIFYRRQAPLELSCQLTEVKELAAPTSGHVGIPNLEWISLTNFPTSSAAHAGRIHGISLKFCVMIKSQL
jgi:hypothetical protein